MKKSFVFLFLISYFNLTKYFVDSDSSLNLIYSRAVFFILHSSYLCALLCI